MAETCAGRCLHGAVAEDAVKVMDLQACAGHIGVHEIGRGFQAWQNDEIVAVKGVAVVAVTVVVAEAEKAVALAAKEGDRFFRRQFAVRVDGVAVQVAFVVMAAFWQNGYCFKHGQPPFQHRGSRDNRAQES